MVLRATLCGDVLKASLREAFQKVTFLNQNPGVGLAPALVLTSVGPPELLHAVPHQHDARQLRERLDDVEVAQRTDLEEGHAVLLGVGPGLLGGHLPLEGQVQAVAHQDARHPRCMLGGERRRGETGYLFSRRTPGGSASSDPEKETPRLDCQNSSASRALLVTPGSSALGSRGHAG